MKSIGDSSVRVAEKIKAAALLPVRAWLPNAEVEGWCRDAGHAWRSRVFDPLVTLAACIYKQLSRGRSARQVEDWIDGLGQRQGGGDGLDFCRARARLPEAVFNTALLSSAQQTSDRAPLWRGLRVRHVDGTTVRAPRTPQNRRAFTCSSSPQGLSILPVVRLALVFCAYTGVVLSVRIGAYTQGELRLFYAQLLQFCGGSLFIGDGAYNSYLTFWKIRQQGSHVLAPLDPTRKSTRIRCLGYKDELQEWTRSPVAVSGFPEELRQAPLRQQVRVITRVLKRKGYRSITLKLCTTLLDAQAYPAAELFEEYLRRWNLEVSLRSIKEHLGLARLTAKTPAIARKEILSALIAYNVVRLASALSGGPLLRISFERTRELLLEFSSRMTFAATIWLPTLQKNLLQLISTATLPIQERPPDPRAILQHPTCYPLLRTPRTTWRRKYRCA
jgi:hypothetical protein